MFEHLLSPVTVGRLALPNRVLVTAHATNYTDTDSFEVHAIGDGVAPRRVEHAVYEAHAVARAL